MRVTDPRSTLQPTLDRIAGDHVDRPNGSTEDHTHKTVREGVHAQENPTKNDRGGVQRQNGASNPVSFTGNGRIFGIGGVNLTKDEECHGDTIGRVSRGETIFKVMRANSFTDLYISYNG